MKKPKRSMGLEEEEPGSPGDLGFDLENQDDDDIIDLEDIVEMPVGSLDEDEDIETDVEILDADADLDFDMLEKKAAGPAKEPSRDLWDELAFADKGAKRVRKEGPEEPLPESGKEPEEELLPKAGVEEKPAPQVEEEEEEEDLLEGLIRAEREKQAAAVKEEPPPAEIPLPALEDDDIDEETFRLMMEEAAREMPKEAAPSMEPPEAPAPTPAEAPAPVSGPAEAPAQAVAAPDVMPAIPKMGHGSPLLDEMIRSAGDFQISAKLNLYIDQLIGGVESKLTDAIREIVVAALPDIVRQIIREELEA